jgi:predicted secreted protein
MALVASGVYPVHENEFEIATSGRAETETFVPIADMETFSVAFDNGVEEWTPMDTAGWIRRLMTAKSIAISLNGKRNIGDAGNDYVAGKSFVNGQDANSILKWNLPDGYSVKIPCVLNVTNNNGGDSTNVAPLEFEAMSDGQPEITEPA